MRMITLVLPEDRSYVKLNNLGDYNEVPTTCEWELSEGTHAFGYRNKGGLTYVGFSPEKRDEILERYRENGTLPRVDLYGKTLRVYYGCDSIVNVV